MEHFIKPLDKLCVIYYAPDFYGSYSIICSEYRGWFDFKKVWWSFDNFI